MISNISNINNKWLHNWQQIKQFNVIIFFRDSHKLGLNFNIILDVDAVKKHLNSMVVFYL